MWVRKFYPGKLLKLYNGEYIYWEKIKLHVKSFLVTTDKKYEAISCNYDIQMTV